MPRKKSAPAIAKVNPKARSFRSTAVGWCTLLFDADFESTIRNAGFNPFQVARTGKPKVAFDTLCQWAEQGSWCAIESHPEIADADGVPGLDLIVNEEHRNPEDGMWFFAGSQFLDLPSGNLRIVYEQEFFEEWYEDEYPAYDITDPELESFENEEFTDATNYLLKIDPGFYLLHAYTLDFARKKGDGRHPDLAIFLTPSSRSKQNRSAKPLIGYAG